MPFCTVPCQTVPNCATLLPATLCRVVPRRAGPAGAVLLTCSSPALKSKHVPASRAQQSGSEHRADGPAVLAPRTYEKAKQTRPHLAPCRYPAWRAGRRRATPAVRSCCIWELTGTLPQEFPLKAGEKPPKVRRRIGAAFKLDESLVLRGADPLGALERDLALQMQIARAAHRLCREENISKQLRRRRKTAALKEEQKLKALEDTLLAERRALSAGGTGGAQEEEQPMGAGTPQRLPSPCPWPRLAPEEQSEDPGCPSAPPGPWRETSLDGPYGKAKSISAEPGDGETRASRCCPTSPPAVTSVPISPDCRAGDVAPYRFIPVRSVVLCRQMGSSAPSTPEPAIRRGQCQSLRVDSRWEPAEARGRSTAPRRRPTYYTVTVPTSCPPAPSPTPRSGSDDSISDVSSVSHATSPGSSSPDVSFPRPPAPPPCTEPAFYPRGAPRLLPPPGPPLFLYEQDLAPLRYQRLVPSHSRIVRTPSLKDYVPGGSRGLSKAAVTEELKSWHQRARLRGARPHSLDRQGAFRGHRCGNPQDGPPLRGAPLRAQAAPIRILRRSPPGVPVQVYVPENGEIITQV
ncbi:innate immunity activator protein isoform X3 [Centrocercus urophasianus]|uniref:innate immunity activator protein isoform X3 n=1 Tax=Centrocercus urophasianus TaxID=9002 RepID=UPI001C65194B|nr:innate immunity activator protein isoform X3 [Centrocercus urophasianus]